MVSIEQGGIKYHFFFFFFFFWVFGMTQPGIEPSSSQAIGKHCNDYSNARLQDQKYKVLMENRTHNSLQFLSGCPFKLFMTL